MKKKWTGIILELKMKKLPVSGGIENDILMPPEKGNFSWFTSKLPFSGGIKMSFSMPPETGNFFSYLGQKWSDFSDLKVKIP